ncbi:MAG: vitamin B12-dependent ribonucleotide reductase [Deltaproteobacteria bacterium]|nr:vitamin B12-dependent ribonucleotide reductase [Deltaproteobacteria bacterium]
MEHQEIAGDLPLSANAVVVLTKRYLKKDDRGRPTEGAPDMFRRVADTIAAIDRIYDPEADVAATARKFYLMMADLAFLPNSPTLMNAGRELGQLSACFVLPVEDSIDSIFDAIKHTALIHKSGGGTGFSFSRIRPESDPVMSTRGVASGPISFMNIFDVATETIKQGGTRRGANMGLLRIDHPDIEKFVTCKNDTKKLTNFNISVGITDAFMEAVAKDADFPLINPRTGREVKKIRAAALFDLIVKSAWATGEPGIIFLDALNRDNTLPHLGDLEATNPCGEQPLFPYESCNLGSLNLALMAHDGSINYHRLKDLVHTAVHFLDNVIDANRFPIPIIEERTKENRKVGLGVMGFADLLFRLGIRYNSEEAVAVAEEVMAFIRREARAASSHLADRRGNFSYYPGSRYDGNGQGRMRNATVTTIAPTGTISIIAGASSGIEPLFAVSFVRRVLEGTELIEAHPYFEELARRRGFYSAELMRAIAQTGSIRDFQEIPKDIRRLFVTAHEVTPQWHIRIQAAFQKHTDNAVSKTVNFPHQAAPEDVRQVYQMAHEMGLKGVTIYRDGSRDEQVLSFGKDKPRTLEYITPRPRPTRTTGATELITTGCGKLYVTVNSDDLGFCEVFAQMGKTGGCASSQIESTGRLISLALRAGVKIEAIIKQITAIRCPSPIWQNGKQVLSCPDAISQVLARLAQVDAPAPTTAMAACPDCGSAVEHEGGCLVCRACGFSKCS